jgi:hypothetical protein
LSHALDPLHDEGAPARRRECCNERLLGAWPRAHDEAQDAAFLNSRARTKPELVLLLIENDNDIHAIALPWVARR